uniref:CCHC-type domain-containing protein n=1 Tax=Tanacetum cinerariifolium TaxID=118510 RepID=A0A6L2MP00_TANCI|nr:hypothetical protein [Tanacetum cinerariifolium]
MEEEEEEEEEEMEIKDEMNDPEIINPYEIEEGELPPPPADSDTSSDSEPEIKAEDEDENEAAIVSTITCAPYHVQSFSSITYVGSGSSHKVFAPGPIGKDVDILHRKRVNAALEAERASQANAEGQGSNENRTGGQDKAPTVREYTFLSFMKCSPTPFYGKEGAIKLCRWFEKSEMVFSISECTERNKVKFVAATLQGRALTWWNSQLATLGLEVANGKSRGDMKKMMMEEFCPDEEVQRLEDELRSLKLRDTNIAAYTQRFDELVLLCPEAVPTEKKKVEAYIKGLPENIKRGEQKIQAKAERIADGNKRKWENSQSGNKTNNKNRGNYQDNTRHHQYNNQRQGNELAMTNASAEQGGYKGNKPLCNSCKKHQTGNYTLTCHNYRKSGHYARDCKKKVVATGVNTQSTLVCYGCREKGHTPNYCPNKNNSQGEEARGRAYVIKEADKNQGPNIVMGTFLWRSFT